MKRLFSLLLCIFLLITNICVMAEGTPAIIGGADGPTAIFIKEGSTLPDDVHIWNNEISLPARMSEQELIDAFQQADDHSFMALMNYWQDIESQYGAFFRWNYWEKPLGARVLSAIIADHPEIDSDWPELQAIVETGFDTPTTDCISQGEAYVYACDAVQDAYLFPSGWQNDNAVCFSFLSKEGPMWRVIFWVPEDYECMPAFTGVVLIDAISGEVISITKNDASSFDTSIPYIDRL